MVPDRANVLVVGGGIVGLTLARELVLTGRDEVVVLEKEPDLGRHASGRNSGVLHAGVYYAEGTLKARSCLAGNRLMRAYCRQKGLPVLETGKVIVARSEEELPTLEELRRRATANGARVEMVGERELSDIEPLARTAGRALLSRDTAVVDPKAVLQAIAADLEASGRCRLVTGCRFLGLAAPGVAETSQGRMAFRRLVNAAGAHCDTVARAFGLAAHYRLIPFKGIYRQLKAGRDYPVRGNIYPVPDVRNPFLGVHFTRGAHGELTLGPTAIPALGRENSGLLRGLDRGGPGQGLPGGAGAAWAESAAGLRGQRRLERRRRLPGDAAAAFGEPAAGRGGLLQRRGGGRRDQGDPGGGPGGALRHRGDRRGQRALLRHPAGAAVNRRSEQLADGRARGGAAAAHTGIAKTAAGGADSDPVRAGGAGIQQGGGGLRSKPSAISDQQTAER